jgi:16S rRNA (guanine966-N2)-methyltransferase
MRVVAGTARGRALQAPEGRTTRPTGDRVRESMFAILSSMDVLEGAAVVDLFAGSGALGIEALSRGAASAVFVERDRAATEVIRGNLALVGGEGRTARVVTGDALGWARAASGGPGVGLVLADPPYDWSHWHELLLLLAPIADLVVAETGRELLPGEAWETVRSRRYGSTLVTVMRPLAAPVLPEGRGLQPVHAPSKGVI